MIKIKYVGKICTSWFSETLNTYVFAESSIILKMLDNL